MSGLFSLRSLIVPYRRWLAIVRHAHCQSGTALKQSTRYRRPKQKQSALQIRDIARMAGVSPQTISRFFKDPDKIKPANRDRIAKIIAETGYHPNPVARSLSSNRSNLVAAIVPTIDHSIFSEIISGLSATLKQKGFALLIASNDFCLAEEEALVRRFLAQKIAGIVLVGQQHSEATRTLLGASGVPVVEVMEIDGEAIDHCIGFSNFKACFEITSRLIASGLRRIAFISAPPEGNDRVQRRLDGYRRAHAEAGLTCDPKLVDNADFSIENGVGVFADMVARSPDIEAVVSNDILGAGALLHCQRVHIPVPGQIAITGFDDLEIASVFEPKLTTVQIKGYRMGVTAAEQIISSQSRVDIDSKTIDLGYQVLWRGTTPVRLASPSAATGLNRD